MPGATGTAAAGMMPAALGGRVSSPAGRGAGWVEPPHLLGGTPPLAGGAAEHNIKITNHSGVAGRCRCLLLRGAGPDSLRTMPATRGARGGTPLNGWGDRSLLSARSVAGRGPRRPLWAAGLAAREVRAAGVQGLICVCSWAGESCCRLSGSNPPTCRGGGLLPLGPPHPSRGGARAVRPRLGPPGWGAFSTLLGWLVSFAGGSVGHLHQAELGCYTGIDEQ
jgi:hypothetical protein